MSPLDAETIEYEDAARLLKCNVDTLMDELRSGNLPGAKFGREWVIPRLAFFRRLNEIALEEAQKRREELQGCSNPKDSFKEAASIKTPGRQRNKKVVLPSA